MNNIEMTTCDWCLQEAPVQKIEEKLWRFWKVISAEAPMVESGKKICKKCSLRYQDFSIYVETCKIHASVIDEMLYDKYVKDEPSTVIDCHPLIKQEISEEARSDSDHGAIVERRVSPCSSNLPVENGDEVLPSGREVASDSDTSLTCPICNAIFDDPSKLEVHLCSHIRAKPFRCSFCDKDFTRPGNLKTHMYVHTGEKPFKCLFCNKAFTRVNTLKVHKRRHTGETPFKCSLCNKACTRAGDLKTHKRVHTGEKPFKCSLCPKAFTVSGNLKTHMYGHTGEKPFKCSLCDKTFTQSGTLKNHMRCHTGEKPFKCSFCVKAFTEASNLRRHLQRHTAEKPYL